jgi:hypothetical protein
MCFTSVHCKGRYKNLKREIYRSTCGFCVNYPMLFKAALEHRGLQIFPRVLRILTTWSVYEHHYSNDALLRNTLGDYSTTTRMTSLT